MKPGKVFLVGAGPGDAGLFTVKGQKLLARAEVVVHDRLVGAEILARIPKTAEVIDVGKTAGNHPVPQEEISRILLAKAQEGKTVVRLKGGDPFLFGRGGEELELLRENAVPFEVVPGVTSAVAAPCYAGIPVTHRNCCSSVHIITGHAKAGGELQIDFDALVRLRGTLVFLMSVGSMPCILQGLADAGMPAGTPAAVIENGTLPTQRKLVATVGTLAERAGNAGIKSPAVLLVGEVCGYHESFDWFGQLPLRGKTVLVTGPQIRSDRLIGLLAEFGARVIPYPCIETEQIQNNQPAKEVLRNLTAYRWAVFTSPAGVEAMGCLLEEMSRDARTLAPVRIAAVGPATAAALRGIGLRADFTPDQYNAAHLAKSLIPLTGEGERVLILRAEAGAEALPEILTGAGIPFDDIPVYRTRLRSESDGEAAELLRRGEVDYVTFTSASAVAGFVRNMEDVALEEVRCVCIGAPTEAAAKQHGLRTIRAEKAEISALVSAILREEGKRTNG